MVTKTCTKCGQAKPLDEFHRYARSSDGRQPVCKACRSALHQPSKAKTAAYREAHRAELLTAQHERYRRHRDRLNELKLTLHCVDCGWHPLNVDEVWWLHFDHIDPETKHSGHGSAVFPSWSWDRIERELALCEPRCRPCHARRTGRERHNLRRRRGAAVSRKEVAR